MAKTKKKKKMSATAKRRQMIGFMIALKKGKVKGNKFNPEYRDAIKNVKKHAKSGKVTRKEAAQAVRYARQTLKTGAKYGKQDKYSKDRRKKELKWVRKQARIYNKNIPK